MWKRAEERMTRRKPIARICVVEVRLLVHACTRGPRVAEAVGEAYKGQGDDGLETCHAALSRGGRRPGVDVLAVGPRIAIVVPGNIAEPTLMSFADTATNR